MHGGGASAIVEGHGIAPPAGFTVRLVSVKRGSDSSGEHRAARAPTVVPPFELPASVRSTAPTLPEDEDDSLGRVHVAEKAPRPPYLARVGFLTEPLVAAQRRVNDSRSAFVLGFIDGVLPLQAIVESVGLPSEEVIAILDALIQAGLIKLQSVDGVPDEH